MDHLHSGTKDTPALPTDETLLGTNFICSQTARQYFHNRLGKGFRFKASFQQWLRSHPDASYAQACEAYKAIMADGRGARKQIAPQFEYNAYIRDFFADNPGRVLSDAIKGWKKRKEHPGPWKYSPQDRY